MDTKQISHALSCSFPSQARKPLTFYYEFLASISVEKRKSDWEPFTSTLTLFNNVC